MTKHGLIFFHIISCDILLLLIILRGDFKKKLNIIFYYDSTTGKLLPDSMDELLEKSSKLNDTTSVLCISDIKEDFQKRIDVLEKILNDNLTTSKEISKESNLYYQSQVLNLH